MNFPERDIVPGPRAFVSEAELAERRQKRQEEWAKTRKPDDPEQAPEEEYDPRTLYERLQENKMKKEAEYEEAHKLKNMIRGLDSDEVAFLEHVDHEKLDREHERSCEEQRAIAEFKEASSRLTQQEEEKRLSESAKSIWKGKAGLSGAAAASPGSSKKSQQASLLLQTVKRKASESEATPSPAAGAGGEAKRRAGSGGGTGRMECIGILPGIGAYSHSDSSDSEKSDSDSDLEMREGSFLLIPKVHKAGQCDS